MHPLERVAAAIRHSRWLERSNGVWNLVRPWYIRLLTLAERRGVKRVMNGTDLLYLSHVLYETPETYEPEVWKAVMAQVGPGDVVADVGAWIGLYTVALAKRVGAGGRVYAFEPDPQSVEHIRRNLDLNQVSARVDLFACALGAQEGCVPFHGGRGSTSAVLPAQAGQAGTVPCTFLDAVLGQQRLDVVKIDVEGYEEFVLRGATGLLHDPARSPRALFVEVHPFAWQQYGVDDRSLIGFLEAAGYRLSDLTGNRVERIVDYGEIVAWKDADRDPAQGTWNGKERQRVS